LANADREVHKKGRASPSHGARDNFREGPAREIINAGLFQENPEASLGKGQEDAEREDIVF